MVRLHYCIKFFRGCDDDDLFLSSVTMSWLDKPVDFAFIRDVGSADDELIHAHFTAPLTLSEELKSEFRNAGLDPSAVRALCEAVIENSRDVFPRIEPRPERSEHDRGL